MNIIRLQEGDQASYSADRIHVWQGASGDYQWSGALVSDGLAAFASGKGFDDKATAEADGISWAEGYVVRLLLVQFGAQ